VIDTIICGDCLEVMEEIPTGSIDAIIIDPPYSSGGRRDANKSVRVSKRRGVDDVTWYSADNLSTNSFIWFMRACGSRFFRVLKEDGHLLSFIDWRMMSNLSAALESVGFKQINLLVWDKTYFGMGRYFRNQHEFIAHFLRNASPKPIRQDVGNVFSIAPVRHGAHPSEKPTLLLEKLISVITNEGDTVFDCFAGSGTTAVACKRSNRHYICVEKEPEYCAIAEKRIAEIL